MATLTVTGEHHGMLPFDYNEFYHVTPTQLIIVTHTSHRITCLANTK